MTFYATRDWYNRRPGGCRNTFGWEYGRLDFECPEVDPYLAIYFFQYSSPSSTNLTWTPDSPSQTKMETLFLPLKLHNQTVLFDSWGIGRIIDSVSGVNGSATTTPPVSSPTTSASTSGFAASSPPVADHKTQNNNPDSNSNTQGSRSGKKCRAKVVKRGLGHHWNGGRVGL
ncbi:hypothetical protein L218DRAFT_949051 [Marasmius fiardii PR-910]|nr:hypothetical protein L218DRAFT_949051 [Marasmius fiardii PR-910]